MLPNIILESKSNRQNIFGRNIRNFGGLKNIFKVSCDSLNIYLVKNRYSAFIVI